MIETMLQNSTKFSTTTTEIALSVTFLVLVNLGIVFSNGLMLVVVWRTRSLHRPNYYFLSSLGVADLLVGLIYCPLLIASSLRQDWMFGVTLCQAHAVTICVSLNASIMSLSAISVDRYFFITKPLKHSRIFTTHRTAGAVVFLWVHAIFWAVAPLLGWGRYTYEDSTATCKPDWHADEFPHKIYALCLGIFCFLIPVCVMVCAYVAIYRAAKKQVQRIHIPESARDEWKTMLRMKFKAMFTVLIIIGLFFLCWSVYTVVSLWKMFATSTKALPFRLIRAGLYLAVFNSCINFYVYALRDRVFRNGLRKLFGYHRRPKRSRDSAATPGTLPETGGFVRDWLSGLSPHVKESSEPIVGRLNSDSLPPGDRSAYIMAPLDGIAEPTTEVLVTNTRNTTKSVSDTESRAIHSENPNLVDTLSGAQEQADHFQTFFDKGDAFYSTAM